VNRSVYKERFKTFLIVVLFLLTVLLSYFYWQGSSISGIKESVNEHFPSTLFTGEDHTDATSFVTPHKVDVNFGNGIYTSCQELAPQLWSDFIDSYIAFTEMENLMIEELSEAQWLETMDMKSIQFVFEYDMPVEFFESLGGSNFGQSDYFNHVSAMALSEASTTSLFIRDDTLGKYYRIISDSDFYPLEEKVLEISSTVFDQYYPIYLFLGTDNYEMAPFSTGILLPELSVNKLSSESILSSEKDLAKTFFGENLDFVRRIVDDSNTITYMYGYGEKMLTIYRNGIFEYKETPSSDVNSAGFNSVFDTAVSFISSHGGWSSFGTDNISAQLRSVSSTSVPKVDTYNFVFCAGSKNRTLYGNSASQIAIEITGDQITYYKGCIPAFDNSSFIEIYPENTSNALITDILARDHQYIAQTLLEHDIITPEAQDMDLFDLVVSNISSISTEYYSQYFEAQVRFVPAWTIDFSGFKVFYDLYTGEFLGYLKETEQ